MRKIKLLSFLSLPLVMSLLSGCGHEHTFSEKWNHDKNTHWHDATCEHKDVVSEEAPHSFVGEYKHDETNHWKECICGEKGEVGAHTFDASGKCSVCNYQTTPIEIVYSFKVNGGDAANLTKMTQDGIVVYVASLEVHANDVFEFFVDGSKITSNINIPPEDSNFVAGENATFTIIKDYTPEENEPNIVLIPLDGGFIVNANGEQESPEPQLTVKVMGLNGDWDNGIDMVPVSEGSKKYALKDVNINPGDEIKIKVEETYKEAYISGGVNNALDQNIVSILQDNKNAKFLLGGCFNIYFNTDEEAGDQYGTFIEIQKISTSFMSNGAYREGSVIIVERTFDFNKVDLAEQFVEYKVIDSKATNGIEYTFKNGEKEIDFTYKTPEGIADKFEQNGKILKYTGSAHGLDMYLKVSLKEVDTYELWIEEHLEYVYDLTIHADSSQSSWAFNDCDLFVYAIDTFNEATWIKVTSKDDLISVTVPNSTIKFLVTRCAIGTVTPDWSVLDGNDPGRIYDKTADIFLQKGQGEYTVTFQHFGN